MEVVKSISLIFLEASAVNSKVETVICNVCLLI